MLEVSNIIFEQFTKNFHERLSSGEAAAAPAEPEPISAGSLAFSADKASVKRKSGGSEPKPERGEPAQESGGNA